MNNLIRYSNSKTTSLTISSRQGVFRAFVLRTGDELCSRHLGADDLSKVRITRVFRITVKVNLFPISNVGRSKRRLLLLEVCASR